VSKISLKTALCAVFFSLTALVLSVCILEPITVNEYVEDDKVQVVIKRDAGKVNIITKKEWPERYSDPDLTLTAGNGKISGLKNDKYYIIEEYVMEDGDDGDDEPAELENTQFVRSDGTRSSRLINIGKVSGGTITGLTNDRWYVVKSAKPLPGTITYYDLEGKPTSGDTGTPLPINDGKITLPGSVPENNYYLEPPSDIDINSANDYPVVKIPVSSAKRTSTVTSFNNLIELEDKGTETDYIFYKEEYIKGKKYYDFYVLKITIKPYVPPIETGEITVTVTFDPDADEGEKLALSSSTTTISKTSLEGGGHLELTVSTSGITGTVNVTGFKVGGKTFTGNTLTIKYGGDIDELLVIGNLDVTVEVTINGTYYSKVFTVTIN
jgi:hypothetical protein